MPKNDEKQPLIDKDDANKTTDYTAEGENVAGGKQISSFYYSQRK